MANGERGEGATPGPVPNEAARESADKQNSDNDKNDERNTSKNDSDSSAERLSGDKTEEKREPEFTPIIVKEQAERLWKEATNFVKQKASYSRLVKETGKRDLRVELELERAQKELREDLKNFKGGGVGSFLRGIFQFPEVGEESEPATKTFEQIRTEAQSQLREATFEKLIDSKPDLSVENAITLMGSMVGGNGEEEDEGPEKSHPPYATEEERRRAERLGRPEDTLEDYARRLGINKSTSELTAEEKQRLQEAYQQARTDYNPENLQKMFREAQERSPQAQLREFSDKLDVSSAWSTQSLLSDLYLETYAKKINEIKSAGREPTPKEESDAIKVAEDAVEEYIDGLLSAAEQDDTNVDQNEQLQLRAAVNFAFARNEAFREHLATKVHARFTLHVCSWAAKYISTELLGQQIINFNTFHWKSILDLGVKKALQILEEPDKYGTKGAYYREVGLDELNMADPATKIIWEEEKGKEEDVKKEVWLVNQKYKLVKAAENGELSLKNLDKFKDQEALVKLVLYKLEQTNQELVKPHTPKTAIAEVIEKYWDRFPKLTQMKFDDNDTQEIRDQKIKAREEFTEFITNIDRDLKLAVRIHHATGISAYYDGPQWNEFDKKEKEFIIPEGYVGAGTKAGKNRLVELKPTVNWEFTDPEDGKEKIVRLDLRTAESDAKNNPLTRRALDDLRTKTRKNFVEIWNKAYRKFYRDHYDDIDFNRSANGNRSARIFRRVVNFPVTLSQDGEAYPGKAEYLRRFTHLHTPSLMQMLGYDSALETVDPSTWGGNFPIMKEGWANPRLGNAEKLKTAIQREEPDILNSTKSLRDFVDSLETKMKPHMKHIMTGTGETGEAVEDWLRGLLEFRRKYSEQVDLLNLKEGRIDDEIDHAQSVGLIGEKKNVQMKRDFFAPKLLKKLSEFKPFAPESFPLGIIVWNSYDFYDAIKKFLGGLSWWKAIFSALGEFGKQIFTTPK